MSKGIMQSLTKFGLPLGLGIVGSLSLVVWSQKPAVQTAVAAPAPVAVTAQEVASFDPFQPTAKVVEAAPAVASTPVAVAAMTGGTEMGPTVNGHLGTVSLGSNAQPVIVTNKETNTVATRSAEDFKVSAVAADSSSDDCKSISVGCATITVGEATINVLSVAKINLP